MHLQQLMGLALLAFAGSLYADASEANPTLPVSDVFNWSGVHPAGGTGAFVPRYLRTNAAANFTDTSAGLAETAEKVKTLFSSSKVTLGKLQKWLDEGKSAESVFRRMSLKKAGEWLFYRPQFAEWLKYVDDLGAKNPTKGTSAIPTLTTHYGDATLYQMIEYAKTFTTTKDLAMRLEKEQMQHWVATAKASDEVFQLMTLDKVNENILRNPKFIAWTKYVDDFSAKYPERPASMVPALVKYYRDDVTLFRIAEQAMQGEGTKRIATQLEDQLVTFWLNARKTPDDALIDLGLGRTVEYMLETPLFNSWLKYTNAYSTNFPHAKTTAIETLTRRFGETKVAKMLGKAKAREETRDLATKLLSAQVDMWRSSGKSVDDVCELLDLRLNIDFPKNPLLNTWVSYMDMYVKENPGKITEILSKLDTRFKDRAMNQILLEAMRFPSMKSAATKIQAEKIKSYAANKESPVRVFQWLNLDNVGDTLLGDPLFTKWLKYAKDFNKENPNQRQSVYLPIRMEYNPAPIERMIEAAMKNPSTVNIAKLIQRERFRHWLDVKDPPRRVFHLIRLNKAGEKTLASPDFKLWAKYLNDFNHRYPDEKTTMIDGIRANYIDLVLVDILHAAKQDPNTEKLAVNLESALINKWVSKKEPLEALTRRFNHKRIADGLIKEYAAKLNALAGRTS